VVDAVVSAVDRHPGPISGTIVGQAASASRVQLAVSGWSICWHLQPDSQTVIEVSD